MRLQLGIALLIGTAVGLSAQVASHAPTITPPAATKSAVVNSDQPVVRVNGAVLTQRDLLREMYAIFPYARQHNGFPKAMEAEIRQGALRMIVFEELVYQEAERRKIAVSAARLDRAVAQWKAQFPDPEEFQRYLQAEHQGSPKALRSAIRRSMLIETLLKSEVYSKASVTLATARAYYDKHPQEFQHPETFSIQTISIIPPQGAGAAAQQEARKRAEDGLRQAKATKSYREFGLLAEKISEDDWHVNMGDRKTMSPATLPPPLLQAARAMQPGQVSDLIQLGPNYTLFRLNAHTLAGKSPFEEVKAKLQDDLSKSRTEELRSALGARLRKSAKVELLNVQQSRR